ncbi:MAG: glycosyltransferase [Akkermansiaceae bacterium]
MKRLQVDGKFFRAQGERVFLKIVTYGPFPDPRPESVSDDAVQLARIAAAGFNAVRIYEAPRPSFLDAARAAGLWVFVGLPWDWWRDFISNPSLFSKARMELIEGLKSWGGHDVVAGVFVANEIPADMVRWMGVTKVRSAIEELISLARATRPELLFAYANFPTTEYLEPDNADFTAMNVYLEEQEKYASYLPRLHNVAGDRPVLLSEFGMDAERNGNEKQRDACLWMVDESLRAGMAGLTVYAWSDWWLNQGRVMDEWSFGLTDREGNSKPALVSLAEKLPLIRRPEDGLNTAASPMFSVVVCTHNGAHRMNACLSAVCAMDYTNYEVIVVDDGSTDDLASVVKNYKSVRLFQVEHMGLSAARNLGAREARGEIIAYTDDDCEPDAAWLTWLADAFVRHGWDACGGPNLPPLPEDEEDVDEAVVACAPGAPSHVLLGDIEAEHLPGCNLVVRKEALQEIGGFNANYWVAGDDVDFCWRLRAADFRMGFAGAAFVWHRRRTTLWRYFKQQYGYGKAEALLMRDHPEKFVRGGGARWQGKVYSGGAMTAQSGDVIYHGPMGTAPYQQLSATMQPMRPLPKGFDHASAQFRLSLAMWLQPRIRSYARFWHSLRWRNRIKQAKQHNEFVLSDSMVCYNDYEAAWWSDDVALHRIDVLAAIKSIGWQVLENESDWDMEDDGKRLLVACEPHSTGVQVLTRVEMGEKSKGKLPVDLVAALHGLGLVRM